MLHCAVLLKLLFVQSVSYLVVCKAHIVHQTLHTFVLCHAVLCLSNYCVAWLRLTAPIVHQICAVKSTAQYSNLRSLVYSGSIKKQSGGQLPDCFFMLPESPDSSHVCAVPCCAVLITLLCGQVAWLRLKAPIVHQI